MNKIYNLNFDKGTPEPFGFKNDDKNLSKEDKFMKKPDPNNWEGTEEDLEKALATWKQTKFGYLLNEDGELELVNGEKLNAIRCFEFLDNAVKVCNFLAEDKAPYVKEDFYMPYAICINLYTFFWTRNE